VPFLEVCNMGPWAEACENSKSAILQKRIAPLTVPGKPAILSISPSLTSQIPGGTGEGAM
jgi:hypothetical protein